MQRYLRLLALAAFAVAAVSVASSPITKNNVVFAEGSSPVPLCDPRSDCPPPIPPM
jgi:hypothetical protein